MKVSEIKLVEWFLRVALSAGFLSASADRLGMWPKKMSAWGNWQSFVDYTKSLNPLVPDGLIPTLAIVATALEIGLGILLLTSFKTRWIAAASGVLLALFGCAIVFSQSIKLPLDYSVFTAAAAAFALSLLVRKKQVR